MSAERFTVFYQTFERVLKNIRRIAMPVMQHYGLRSVHTTCLLALRNAPEGLSVTELSHECMIDKSLASRMLRELSDGDFIAPTEADSDKNYNKRYILTPKSQTIMTEIAQLIAGYVNDVGLNVSDGDREIFYRVLSEFDRNIESLGNHMKNT